MHKLLSGLSLLQFAWPDIQPSYLKCPETKHTAICLTLNSIDGPAYLK